MPGTLAFELASSLKLDDVLEKGWARDYLDHQARFLLKECESKGRNEIGKYWACKPGTTLHNRSLESREIGALYSTKVPK